MTVSIIIAVVDCCGNLRECVGKCLQLDYDDYEIIILPNASFPKENIFSSPNIKIIPTGNVTPPYKRDIGAKEAKGEILAFIDDDAYPVKRWLSEAIEIFNKDKNISCVCGPAVTPPEDSLRQKASGIVYSSPFISGNHKFRYVLGTKREVFDFPSCNFFIRKDVFNAVGGFDKPFWPGEDTFLCLKVLNAAGKMVYNPKVLVFHHRRPLFKKHLIQIKNYAYHRGYFVKKYPRTSFRLEYFIPSFFMVGIVLGVILSCFFGIIRIIYFSVLSVYLVLIIFSSGVFAFQETGGWIRRIQLSLFTISGIIFTHLTYGFYFIKGLCAVKMPEEE